MVMGGRLQCKRYPDRLLHPGWRGRQVPPRQAEIQPEHELKQGFFSHHPAHRDTRDMVASCLTVQALQTSAQGVFAGNAQQVKGRSTGRSCLQDEPRALFVHEGKGRIVAAINPACRSRVSIERHRR